MNKRGILPAITLSVLLAGPLVGCASGEQKDVVANDTEPKQEQMEQNATEPVAQDKSESKEKKDDGRIDVKSAAPAVATYYGDKLIVSDATSTQEGMETKQDGFGVQEMCVIKQPESWKQISSIGWSRNSISYGNIAEPWGTISYSFEYINEASVGDLDPEISRTTPESYFGSLDDAKEFESDGHKVVYVRDDAPSLDGRFTYEDLEAAYYGVQRDTSNDVGIHIYEQRGDKCAFTIALTCSVNEGSKVDKTDEELVAEALSVVSFTKENTANAASCESDDTITSWDNTQSVVVKRNGSDLLGYTEHGLAVSEQVTGENAQMLRTHYDFSIDTDSASYAELTGNIDELSEDNGFSNASVTDVQDFDVDGLKVHARVASAEVDYGDEVEEMRELRAWVEADGGKILGVQAVMNAGEDVEAAIGRTISGRLTFSAVS